MNNRESANLDRYITGNYGEDQFKNKEDEESDYECRLCGVRTSLCCSNHPERGGICANCVCPDCVIPSTRYQARPVITRHRFSR